VGVEIVELAVVAEYEDVDIGDGAEGSVLHHGVPPKNRRRPLAYWLRSETRVSAATKNLGEGGAS